MSETKFNQSIEAVKNNGGLEANKREVINFNNQIAQNGITVNTRITYLACLKPLLSYAEQRPFKSLNKEDIIDFLDKLKNRKFEGQKQKHVKSRIVQLSDSTMVVYRSFVKKFLQFVYGLEDREFPDCVGWIKVKPVNNQTIFKKDLLTQEQIFKMIQACDNGRDRALVVSLWESAARIREFLSVRIKDITFDKYGVLMTLPVSKTRPRQVRLIYSVSFLEQWLSCHPHRNDPDSPAWVNLYNKDKDNVAIGRETVASLLRRLAMRTGINKRVHPHLLRHCRLTDLAKIDFSEQELKVFAGWSRSSGMASRYCHLDDDDVNERLLQKSKVKKLDKSLEEQVLNPRELQPKTCPRCGTENMPDSKFCTCGQVLSQRYAFDLRDTQKIQGIQDTVLNQLSRDPEWLEMTVAKITQKQLDKALAPLMAMVAEQRRK